MIFVLADLRENQREVIQQTMFNRNLSFTALTPEDLSDMLRVMLCAPRSSLENPSYSHGSAGGPRSFLAAEYGEIDGHVGQWCLGEASDEQGFLALDEDSFWMYDDSSSCWTQQRFQGRRLYSGKPKGKLKGGFKGARGKDFSRPMFRPKGKKASQKSREGGNGLFDLAKRR